MLTTVVLLSVLALVQSHDIQVGNNTDGRKIFDEVRHASPTIWRQTEILTINTTDAEVISRVVITDLRPDKDGDAKIVEGGEGEKNVTVELKSPTVLRGYDFQVQVYAVPDDDQHKSAVDKEDASAYPGQVRKQRNPEEFAKNGKPLDFPSTIFEDAKKLESTTDKNGSTLKDTKVNDDQTTVDDSAEEINEEQGSTAAGKETSSTTETPQSKGPRHIRDATIKPTASESQQTTPADAKTLQTGTVRLDSYYTDELFPRNNDTDTQEEKRNLRDVIQDDKTQPPVLTNQQTKSDDPTLSTSTTVKSTEESTSQQPRIIVPYPKVPQYPVPYHVHGNVAPTTEKSQIKRESDSTLEGKDVKYIPRFSTFCDEQEEKDGVKSTPCAFGVQNPTEPTTSGQKPVISLQ